MNITTLKSDLTSILHGTTTNQITNLDGLINRAARQVLLDCDPQETKRILAVSGTVFTDVWDYPCPTDLKGNRIIDIFPQVNRAQDEIFTQTYNQRFDILKTQNTMLDNFTILFNTGVKTLRINFQTGQPPIVVNDCDSTTSNGTWAVGGNASNLSVDNINFVSSGGSLKFDLSAGGAGSTGYLQNSTQSAVDLSDDENQGTFFLYTYLPTASNFNSVNLRFGSSASNYWNYTATVTQENTSFQNGWNLLAFPWVSATKVGSPNSASISYLRVTWTYDGTAQTGVRLDNITESLGQILNLEYYSKYLFRDSSTGTFQETVTSDSNLINLDTESYNLLTWKVCEYAIQQQQGLDASFYDGPYFGNLYQQTLGRYLALYKSEVQKPQQTYYQMPNPKQNITSRTRFGF